MALRLMLTFITSPPTYRSLKPRSILANPQLINPFITQMMTSITSLPSRSTQPIFVTLSLRKAPCLDLASSSPPRHPRYPGTCSVFSFPLMPFCLSSSFCWLAAE